MKKVIRVEFMAFFQYTHWDDICTEPPRTEPKMYLHHHRHREFLHCHDCRHSVSAMGPI